MKAVYGQFPERVEIPAPRFAPWVGIVSCVGLLALNGYLMRPATGGDPGGGIVIGGFHLAMSVFVVYMLYLGLRVVRDPRPLLVIDRDGVSSRLIHPVPLPWSEIAGARRVEVDGGDSAADQDLLCIQLRDASRHSQVRRLPPGLLGWIAGRRNAEEGIAIDLAQTRADVPALVAMVNAHVSLSRTERRGSLS